MIFALRVPSDCRLGAIIAGLMVLSACASSPARPDTDAQHCAQTYEFGNYGCTDIAGQVLGSAGQPLAGIYVGPRYLADRDGFNAPYVTTDAEGLFRLRLTRFSAPPPAGEPDTVSLYVRASDPSSSGVDLPATIQDSVLVHVTVAPVGAVAPMIHVVLRLPKP